LAIITAAIRGAVLNGARNFIVAHCHRFKKTAMSACQRAVSADQRVDARIYTPVIGSDIAMLVIRID
jgi:hypothetical protein